MSARATAFAPATIGNVGPGFDVLGLAVDGLGDRATVELGPPGPDLVTSITGRDADLVPREPEKNAAVIAARAMLSRLGAAPCSLRVGLEKGLPLAGGLGGSAASSVAGALAAALALTGRTPSTEDLLLAALEGEAAVAGRHLDNLAPCALGGLVLVRSVEPLDVIPLPPAAPWWVALVTPAVRVETRAARALLPKAWEQAEWVRQMAHTSALVVAFLRGDAGMARRALDDRYAEPRRAVLIPRFAEVKAAALEAGALGCSLSGSGPTLFALAEDEAAARRCAAAMTSAFQTLASTSHVGPIAKNGARPE